MDKRFLDKEGLKEVWTKASDKFQSKEDLPGAIAEKLPLIISTGLAMNDGKLEVDLSSVILQSIL